MIIEDSGDGYSQARAAYHYGCSTKNASFKLLIIGFNKADLVHEDSAEFYVDYVLNQIADEMKDTRC